MSDSHRQPNPIPDYFPDDLPRFMPGQVVTHRLYSYRGVVVDFDMACHAAEEWYHANQTQPARDQPWYHVLVDGAHMNTYVAQQNLLPSNSPEPIDHPLIDVFFDCTADGCYDRNDEPWPT